MFYSAVGSAVRIRMLLFYGAIASHVFFQVSGSEEYAGAVGALVAFIAVFFFSHVFFFQLNELMPSVIGLNPT